MKNSNWGRLALLAALLAVTACATPGRACA